MYRNLRKGSRGRTKRTLSFLGEHRVGRADARYSTVQTSSFSQKLSDVLAQLIRKRATLLLPKSTSKSRLLSTVTLPSLASSRRPKRRLRRPNTRLTSTRPSLLLRVRRVMRHSSRVTLQALSSCTRKASSATPQMLEVTTTALQHT